MTILRKLSAAAILSENRQLLIMRKLGNIMKDNKFVGRSYELNRLESAYRTKTSSLIVIKGRRRIGKSRLIREFAAGHKFYKFAGLAPDQRGGVDAQAQRDHFALRLHQQTGLPEILTDDWSKLFSLLKERTQSGRVVILLDEITWMAADDETFLSKLQSAWEEEFKYNPELILVLCGSVSAWIEKNILSSTGYFGRISIKLTLEELSLKYCGKLLNNIGFKGSSYEALMLLGITGGVPWYLEQYDPGLTTSENIKRLCFVKESILSEEFQRIFHDLFGENRYRVHVKIVNLLAQGPAVYNKIADGISYKSSGSLTDYLTELENSGFIKRDFTWQIKTGKASSLSQYRLCDNYLRFYLKYIEPKLDQINRNQYLELNISSLPGWNAMMGLQIENLVLNNRADIHKALSIDPTLIVQDNPFFQRKTAKSKGVQIDYLIQTKHKTIYVVEIKFHQEPLGIDIIADLEEKIKRISLPRGYSCLPVLVAVNGVKQTVLDKSYFFKIIDLCDLLFE